MLRASLRKIKSAHRYWLIITVIAVILLGIFSVHGSNFFQKHESNSRSLVLNSRIYSLEVVTTQKDMEHGLSDRSSMPIDHGMLFDFGSEGRRCIWMKDMHFPLDIIWADSDKKVVGVERNISPATYPTAYCSNARYVIEVNAGTVSNRLEQSMNSNFHLSIK